MPIIQRCPQCNFLFESIKGKRIFCSRYCKGKSQKFKVKVQCVGCGKLFWKYPYLKRKTNYCGVNCYRDATRKKSNRICIVCNKSFRCTRAQMERGFGKYCSRACQYTLYPKRIVIKCQECGKQVETPPSKQHLVKFCSKKCKDQYERDYVTKECGQCKQEFQLPSSDANRGRGLFCSHECYKHYTGETSIEKSIRECLERYHVKFTQEAKIGRYYADFLIDKLSIIIECDGVYWHAMEKAKIRDKRKDEVLEKKGYKIFRFPESKIRESAERCLGSIFNFSYS